MNPKLSKEIQAEQAHGRQKYGGSVLNFGHDDAHHPMDWINMIDHQSNEAAHATPQEYRQRMVKIAGLAASAIESFDRKAKNPQKDSQ